MAFNFLGKRIAAYDRRTSTISRPDPGTLRIFPHLRKTIGKRTYFPSRAQISQHAFAEGKKYGYPTRAVLDYITDLQHGRSRLHTRMKSKVAKIGNWLPARAPQHMLGHPFWGNQYVKKFAVRVHTSTSEKGVKAFTKRLLPKKKNWKIF